MDCGLQHFINIPFPLRLYATRSNCESPLCSIAPEIITPGVHSLWRSILCSGRLHLIAKHLTWMLSLRYPKKSGICEKKAVVVNLYFTLCVYKPSAAAIINGFAWWEKVRKGSCLQSTVQQTFNKGLSVPACVAIVSKWSV